LLCGHVAPPSSTRGLEDSRAWPGPEMSSPELGANVVPVQGGSRRGRWPFLGDLPTDRQFRIAPRADHLTPRSPGNLDPAPGFMSPRETMQAWIAKGAQFEGRNSSIGDRIVGAAWTGQNNDGRLTARPFRPVSDLRVRAGCL
jgi:hypothetical protein